MKASSARERQRGAALIVALLIAALVAVMGVRIGNEYQMTFRRSTNVMYSDQVHLFLLSAETVAKQLLMADDDPAKDFRGEPWASEFPPLPIGEGLLLAAPIVDLQGRFNINSLGAQPRNAGGAANYTSSQKMFIRLLNTLPDIEMDTQRAEDLTEAIADWIDEDKNERGFAGAEDGYYGQLDIPYRAANTFFHSTSELRLVKGVDRELFRALAPHIAALPESVTRININGAGLNVLRALSFDGGSELQPLDEQSVSSYLESYEPAVGYNKEDFLAQSPWNSSLQGPNADALVSATSSYFQASARAKLGELTLPMQSILWRKSVDDVVVLSRNASSL